MPVVSYTVENLEGNVRVITWDGLANGDTGSPYDVTYYNDISVQVYGTFGAGGNCRIQGTNQTGTPTQWAPLADPQGNILDFTSAGIEQVEENVIQLRPNITAGDGTTSLTVILKAMVNMPRWRAQE